MGEDLEIYIDDEDELGGGDDVKAPDPNNNNNEFDEKAELIEVPLSSGDVPGKKSMEAILSEVATVPSRLNTYSASNRTADVLAAPTSTYSVRSPAVDETPKFDLLDKLDYDERVIASVSKVSCLCDMNRGVSYASTKERNVYVNGRLVLTNFRLQFVPYHPDDAIDLGRVFTVERNLLLFAAKSSQMAVFIPLTHIFDIRASKAHLGSALNHLTPYPSNEKPRIRRRSFERSGVSWNQSTRSLRTYSSGAK